VEHNVTEPDKVEQVKKPSTGATITRKINIGEKYENVELEVWSSSGSLDDTSREALKQELEEIVEDLVEIVEDRVEDWKAQTLSDEELEDVLDEVERDLKAGDVEPAGQKLQTIRSELQER
jgi:hypothetical protein